MPLSRPAIERPLVETFYELECDVPLTRETNGTITRVCYYYSYIDKLAFDIAWNTALVLAGIFCTMAVVYIVVCMLTCVFRLYDIRNCRRVTPVERYV